MDDEKSGGQKDSAKASGRDDSRVGLEIGEDISGRKTTRKQLGEQRQESLRVEKRQKVLDDETVVDNETGADNDSGPDNTALISEIRTFRKALEAFEPYNIVTNRCAVQRTAVSQALGYSEVELA